nr:glycosyltransferase family 4 protein [Actinomycetales bacterium]
MRVLHMTDAFLPRLGGIEVQVAGLALAQAARGDEVAILTTTLPASREGGRSVEWLVSDGAGGLTITDAPSPSSSPAVRVHRVATRMPLDAPVHPLAPRHLAALVKQFDPEVVHFHMGIATPSVEASLGQAADRVRVLQVHSVWTLGSGRAYGLVGRLSPFPPKGVQLAAVSRLAALPVSTAFGRPVMVIGNGLELGPWRVDPVEHEGVHVVTATRFARRKRVPAMLRVLRDAAEELGEGHGMRATIAGDGPGLEPARRWVEDQGMAGWVEFPGRQSPEQLRALYARADIYLSPVVLEAFSIAVLEAQAAGLAIVVREQSGAAERIVDGRSGLTADDDDGLTAALVRLVRDQSELDRIRAHNRAVPPPYDWPSVVARTDEVYAAAQRLLE